MAWFAVDSNHFNLDICPGMKSIIEYVRNIQAARLGEYDYYLKDIHTHSDNEQNSFNRLFEMSLRSAVKAALYYHKKYDVDIEDAFQEACIGVILAIKKHNENVEGLFPSYVSMWMRQVLNRDLAPYEYNVHIPVHYTDRIEKILDMLQIDNADYKKIEHDDLYRLLIKHAGCDEKEAYRIAYLLSPAESINIIEEELQKLEQLDNRKARLEQCPEDLLDISAEESAIGTLFNQNIVEMLSCLKERPRKILELRYGLDGKGERTLEEVGTIFGVTRERIRQIEAKAMEKLTVRARLRELGYPLNSETEKESKPKKRKKTLTE